MLQPLAYVHPEAKIGQNVVIEPFAVIHKDVEIGDGTWIGSNAVIFDGARIGKNCKIFPGASISAIPQDLKYQGEDTYTFIGDNTTIRECVTLNKGTGVSIGKTVIGSNCLIMAYCHVAHDCVLGNNVIMANGVQLGGHIEIDDFAFIGGTSAVHQFVRIGKHAIVGGGSLVRKDIPPYIKGAREPMTYIGLNGIGLKRRGFTPEQIAQLKDIYHIVYLSGLNFADATKAIELEIEDTPERQEVLSFMKTATRGIMKAPKNNNKAEQDDDDDM
jgi:UDP-N-acetylglucosamine acyltransferase